VVLDEDTLTERQKALVALRTAIVTVTTLSKMFTSGQILKAQSGTDLVEFEERAKVYRAILPTWQLTLKDMEAAEGIFFDLVENVPGILLKLDPDWSPFSDGWVVSKDTTFVSEGD
jgi:hypothetical protein